MGTRVHPVLVALVVLVVVVVVALVYARRTEMPKVAMTSGIPDDMAQMQNRRGSMRGGGEGGRGGTRGGRGGAGGEMTDPTLKFSFGPSQSPTGLKVDKMEEASPLKIMGLKEGDVITSANGQKKQIKSALGDGIQALQTRGTPVKLTIDRGGKTLTIDWTKKLPSESLQAKPQEPAAGGGKRGG